MNKTIENYSKNYWLIILVFFGIFTAGQCLTAYYWDKELKLLDIFQLVLAPACCFSIASLTGLYKDKLMALITPFYVWLLGNIFYAIFEKVSFFKDSDMISLIFTNSKIFGIPLAIETIIAVLISYFLINKKAKIS
jgi:hypothetical protein